MTAAVRFSSRLADRLVCPYDRLPLVHSGNTLRCTGGHAHRMVQGIPILLREDVQETHWHFTQAREAPDEGYPYKTTNGINEYVQEAISATGGYMYRPLAGNLTAYPVPDLRLRAVGIDPSLPAVQAAFEVAQQLGIDAEFVVADARHLPFADRAFDAVFSYSVLQHFSKSDVKLAVAESARVLDDDGISLIQMPNAFGLRSLFHQIRRGFREAKLFEVRYWTARELNETFSALVGPSSISIDGFLSLNVQPDEAHLLPARYRFIVRLSEALRRAGRRFPSLSLVADSLYVESHKRL